MQTIAPILTSIALVACSSSKSAPKQEAHEVALPKLGLTVAVTHKVEKLFDRSSGASLHFGSGGPASVSIDVVDQPKPVAELQQNTAAKLETLADGYLVSFGDKNEGYEVHSYRTISDRKLHCYMRTFLIKDVAPAVAACKSVRAPS